MTRMVSQSQDSQNMQQGLLEENLRLHDAINEAKRQADEARAK